MDKSAAQLNELLSLAQWGPRQLVAAINSRLSRQGQDRLRLDPTAAYPWIRQGFCPRPPIPDHAAAVLSERLGRPVAPAEIWPGHAVDTGRPSSAAAGLGGVVGAQELLHELGRLTSTAASPRTSIAGASGVDLTAAVLDQVQGGSLSPQRRPGRESVSLAQVDAIASHVDALRRLDDRHGGGALSLRYVSAELRSVIDLAEYASFDARAGAQLLSIVADLAQLLGWLHFDSGHCGPSQRYLLLSIGVCRALKDGDRAANVIGMLSYVSSFAGHGVQAVRLAEMAQAESATRHPVLMARLLGREATAAAADGDLARFRRSSEAATELLERAGSAEPLPFLYYLTPAQLTVETGQALVGLAERAQVHQKRLLGEGITQMSEAVRGMVHPPSGSPVYARSGLLHCIFLARAQLLFSDAEDAIASIRAGLGVLPLVQSPRCRHNLRGLRPLLARRSRSTIIRDFLPEFDAAISSA